MGWELVRRRPIVVEDFLPIPSPPIQQHTAGEGRLWQGQDGGVRTQPLSHKPGALKMAFISQGRARPQLG